MTDDTDDIFTCAGCGRLYAGQDGEDEIFCSEQCRRDEQAAHEAPVIGDDAEAAIEARAQAERDLTAFLVALMASHASGDPEDTYEQYLLESAGKLGINLEAALDEAAEKGWLDDIDRPGEEVRREPQIGQENVEAICARIVGPDRWPLVEPKARFDVAEQVLEILNAATATGWTPPAGDAS